MSKTNQEKETVVKPSTSPVVTTAQTALKAEPTEDKSEAKATETSEIDGKKVGVLVVDEIADALKAEPTEDKSYYRLRDGGSCWGIGGYFIANKEIVLLPNDSLTLQGVNDKAIIRLSDDEAEALVKK